MNIEIKTILNDEEFLRQRSIEVDFQDKSYLKDIEKLKEYCNNNEVFALAAVQLGILKRIIYIKNTDLEKVGEKFVDESIIMINPKIIEKYGQTKFWEACASCLDNTGLVTRPYKIKIEYYDIEGKKKHELIEGFKATVFCHEFDHLNGILHIDIAEKVFVMTQKERIDFRKKYPYEIIDKNKIWK